MELVYTFIRNRHAIAGLQRNALVVAQEIGDILHSRLIAHEIVERINVPLNDTSRRATHYSHFLGGCRLDDCRGGS
jgi:hypothetical protein